MLSPSHARIVRISVLALLLLAGGPAFGQPAARPAGVHSRVPWTTSRVLGSPEPPPPYQLERAYPKLTFNHPLDMNFCPGSDRRFVAEQGGKILSFANDESADKPDVFFDGSQVRGLNKVPDCTGLDQVFGFAFHPKFEQNHYVYVCYVLGWNPNAIKPDKSKGERVSRFTVKGGTAVNDPPRCDPDSEVVLLEYWGYGHCGGCLKFGPDGCLYISTGDGGDPTPPDPFNTGQNIGDLLASILRIDVDHADAGKPYAIPKDNPFVQSPGARGEVWAYGLRNPWRFSFDRQTGEAWAGDVGWETWEMVYRIERGGNYGWSITEGPGPVHPDGKRGPTPILPPTLYLSHAEAASITGGFVYRGKKLPALAGQYIFGDWETRRLWAAPRVEKGLGKHQVIAMTDQRIVAFGEDGDGELYVVDYEGGGLWRIVPQPPPPTAAAFPRKLSETGLFAATERGTPAPGVVPFTINAEQWVDFSTSERWAAVPGTDAVKIVEGKTVFPKNSVLTRTFSLETEAGNPATRRRVETQMLHYDGKHWNAYTYRWDDAQGDAALVNSAGEDVNFHIKDASAPGGTREQTWHFNSRAQCMTCHSSWSNYALAFTPAQLTRVAGDDQTVRLRNQNLLTPMQVLADPRDESADLDARARSYLHANCAHCHRFGGGGSANIELQFSVENDQTKAINSAPTQGTFGIADARIIAPGDSSRSVLYYRMAKSGSGHMPHTGSTEIDPQGLALIRQWIEQMSPAEKPDVPARFAAIDQLQQPHLSADARAAVLNSLLSTTRGALDVMNALDEKRFVPTVGQQTAALAYANDRDEVRSLFARFVPAEQRIKTLGTSFKAEDVLTLTGDASRGRKVFFEVGGGLCNRCHRVGDEGEAFGPELTHVGDKYDRVQLLENIVEPSKVISPGFTTYRVKVRKGEPLVGLIVSRTEKEIVLRTAAKTDVRIPAGDVERLTVDATSLMPEGLLGGLTAQQAADLLDYLQSLRLNK